ncbi:MAG: DUF86 domain-containing protein [Candidatus Methanofastidiosum sp.]|nr:DUF86 domain-containing protein [Methanofastidiosum sp.]NYT13856.1 DUF86 domain-containing protein [Candidatus Methanofastidiosa archaeon]
MSLRDEKLYIDDILEAIYKIEEYIQDIDFEDFSSDRKSVDAVIRNLEIIGEATKNISEDFKRRHTEVNWKDPTRMRDRLIHAYFGVDLGIVWETIKFRIPELKGQIEKINENI